MKASRMRQIENITTALTAKLFIVTLSLLSFFLGLNLLGSPEISVTIGDIGSDSVRGLTRFLIETKMLQGLPYIFLFFSLILVFSYFGPLSKFKRIKHIYSMIGSCMLSLSWVAYVSLKISIYGGSYIGLLEIFAITYAIMSFVLTVIGGYRLWMIYIVTRNE